jgi:hypothetical protein
MQFVDDGLHKHEHIHTSSCSEGGKYSSRVWLPNLDDVGNANQHRMAGGVLMTLVGLGYLIFEESVLGRPVPKRSLSRVIIGIQVCLLNGHFKASTN